jgi:rare lipoprotein A (peptidoglycan hydrolase)
MKKLITTAVLGLTLSGCAGNNLILGVEKSGNVKRDYVVLNASWYQRGRLTASGERFNPDGISVAHRTYPFGTMLRMTNPATGATVVARVNDRGPFVKGVSLDVSRGAARQLGMIRSGCAALRVEVLNQIQRKPKREYAEIDLETTRLQVVEYSIQNDDTEG